MSLMDTYPLVLIANEPGTYRSLLASELPFLRPNLRIQEIEPDELETTLTTLHPAVILCSRAPEHVHDAEVTILVLHAGEVDMSLHSEDGAIANPQLSDILAAIDRAVLGSTPVLSPPQRSESHASRGDVDGELA